MSLRVDDIDWIAEGGASVLLRRSKTDQEGAGKWLYLSNRTAAALKDWIDAASVDSGLILRGVLNNHSVSEQLGEAQIPRIYKRLARAAGLGEPIVSTISGHSLRVGGAQDLLIQGASLPQIMVKGGWSKTDTVMRHAENHGFYV